MYRGTWQGCPLSPMLFILALEPLAVAIRSSPIIKGINFEDREHWIALYADDTILFLTRLERSIPALLRLIDRFRKFSGYKINNTKSSVLFLNTQERSKPPINHPFINTVNGFNYLGVVITPTTDKWIPANCNPVITKFSESLDRWLCLPVPLIDCINIIKMNIKPKFLYLFRSIPLPPPSSFFP